MYKELIRTRANKAGGQKHIVKMTDDNYTKLIYWSLSKDGWQNRVFFTTKYYLVYNGS